MGLKAALVSCLLPVVVLTMCGSGDAAKILVAPLFSGFNSRLINMQKMADMLAQDGHEVSVLVNNKVEDHVIVKHSKVISFNIEEDFSRYLSFSPEDLRLDGFSFFAILEKVVAAQVAYCKYLFKNEEVMKMLRESDFDLMLADLFSVCNPVLAAHLNTTTIWYQNYGFATDHNAFYPQFPSFTCHAIGTFCVSDDMSFWERTMNTVFMIGSYFFIMPAFLPTHENMAKEAGLELKAPITTITKDKVVIVNVDYVLDPPRPTMPHVFPISGLFNKKASPLSANFQKIIDQSGAHGVVILSFGTLVPKFDPKTAEMFARVFGKLKQQVIWRYTGEPPKGLQGNTHLTEWLPQNDILANPAAKVFITHCGISSTHESAYNGVPVIAMPLFADQTYNAKKLSARVKMGVELDYYTVTEDQFEAALNEVLANPVYKENAQRAKSIMSDQVAPPIKKFLHIVNFTINSGGAKHLFHPYAAEMSWFTFYGLDVISFLLSIIFFVIFFIYFVLRAIFRCICGKKIKQKQQ